MKPGDIVRLKNIETVFSDGRSSVTFKPMVKDGIFVCLFLGVEKRKIVVAEDSLDPHLVMRMLGWQPIPEAEPVAPGVVKRRRKK